MHDAPAAELPDSPSDGGAGAEANESNEGNKGKSGLETPERVSRPTFELAEDVAAFLEKLAPWKPIMPTGIVHVALNNCSASSRPRACFGHPRGHPSV